MACHEATAAYFYGNTCWVLKISSSPWDQLSLARKFRMASGR